MARPNFARFAAAALALVLALPAAASDSLLSEMESVKSKAFSYEYSENYTFAYRSLAEYADLAASLAESGEVTAAEADMAAAHRDFVSFSPKLFAAASAKRGVFVGSDGYFADGASAVKISIPYGEANVEDYLHLIPKTSRELCVLVTFDVTSERAMRNIAFGKDDEGLAENLRQLSLIEGRVYLAFCPSVNMMRRTRTLVQSYTSAYRHVADAARRYAPNTELVYSLADVLEAGEDTVAMFYPGDGYVDVFGVELCHTYSGSDMPSSEAAFDRRGEYYDPVYSVRLMTDKFAAASGDDSIPVAVTGCSFPWGGKAAIDGWAEEMERFFRLVPLVCPDLTAVFYSNESSALGICNLRQNADAAALYEDCLAMPWYGGAKGTLIEDGGLIPVGTSAELELYCGGKFSGSEYEIWLDGAPAEAGAVLTGEHDLTVYITDWRCSAKIEYSIVPDGGMLRAELVLPEYDYNGNGYLDFGDSDLLTAYVAKWKVDMGDIPTDVNGDGKTNISDIRELLRMMLP